MILLQLTHINQLTKILVPVYLSDTLLWEIAITPVPHLEDHDDNDECFFLLLTRPHAMLLVWFLSPHSWFCLGHFLEDVSPNKLLTSSFSSTNFTLHSSFSLQGVFYKYLRFILCSLS